MSRLFSIVVAIVLCAPRVSFGSDVSSAYPILAIPKTGGTSALTKHELTPKERKLFLEIDERTAKLPRTATSAEYHVMAAEVGKRYGLTRAESVAFFVRTTFGYFEP